MHYFLSSTVVISCQQILNWTSFLNANQMSGIVSIRYIEQEILAHNFVQLNAAQRTFPTIFPRKRSKKSNKKNVSLMQNSVNNQSF